MKDLRDNVILINGLSSDIGIAIGSLLSQKGCYVAGTFASSKNRAQTFQNQHKNVKIFKCDLTGDAPIDEIVDKVVGWKGRIDTLINVAGIWRIKPFLYEDKEEIKQIWDINYFGAVDFSQAVIRKMLQQGHGDIINIASSGGIRGAGQQAQYAATKAALINLTKSLAEEFGPRNIKVNCISPGPTDTRALNKILDKVSKELVIKNIPRTRLCRAEDVADAVYGILINDYMTGSNIVLHGGKL